MNLEQFEEYLNEILNTIGTTLKKKNRSYGGSAVKPLNIFTKLGVKERLLVRIEDKLKRIQALGISGFGEDNLNDLIGYLLILKIQDLHEKKLALEDSLSKDNSEGETSNSKVEGTGRKNGRVARLTPSQNHL
jgi:hypothetical protein